MGQVLQRLRVSMSIVSSGCCFLNGRRLVAGCVLKQDCHQIHSPVEGRRLVAGCVLKQDCHQIHSPVETNDVQKGGNEETL